MDRTKHLKVWISYAKFEGSAMEEVLQGSDMPESDYKRECLQRARGTVILGVDVMFSLSWS